MTWDSTEDSVRERSAAVVRAELVASFNDYHSHIARQVALVDELIAAVAREEGEKYGHNSD